MIPNESRPNQLTLLAHYSWKGSFCRKSTTAVSDEGAQLYQDCRIDEYGEPVGLSFKELASRRSGPGVLVSAELPATERSSDELPASPEAKRSRSVEHAED